MCCLAVSPPKSLCLWRYVQFSRYSYKRECVQAKKKMTDTYSWQWGSCSYWCLSPLHWRPDKGSTLGRPQAHVGWAESRLTWSGYGQLEGLGDTAEGFLCLHHTRQIHVTFPLSTWPCYGDIIRMVCWLYLWHVSTWLLEVGNPPLSSWELLLCHRYNPGCWVVPQNVVVLRNKKICWMQELKLSASIKVKK